MQRVPTSECWSSNINIEEIEQLSSNLSDSDGLSPPGFRDPSELRTTTTKKPSSVENSLETDFPPHQKKFFGMNLYSNLRYGTYKNFQFTLTHFKKTSIGLYKTNTCDTIYISKTGTRGYICRNFTWGSTFCSNRDVDSVDKLHKNISNFIKGINQKRIKRLAGFSIGDLKSVMNTISPTKSGSKSNLFREIIKLRDYFKVDTTRIPWFRRGLPVNDK